jgi:hypothetical protein
MIQGIIAIIAAYVCLRYRAQIVEFTGKFEWAERYLGQGGTYTFVIILGAFFFFWGVGSITGTTSLFMAPLRMLFFAGGVS